MNRGHRSLERLLPDNVVVRDLRSLLAGAGCYFELGGKKIRVPPSARMNVVARSYHTYEYDLGFGDHYRVLIAVGGIVRIRYGIAKAKLSFASLWYSEERKLVTVDFRKGCPEAIEVRRVKPRRSSGRKSWLRRRRPS